MPAQVSDAFCGRGERVKHAHVILYYVVLNAKLGGGLQDLMSA